MEIRRHSNLQYQVSWGGHSLHNSPNSLISFQRAQESGPILRERNIGYVADNSTEGVSSLFAI